MHPPRSSPADAIADPTVARLTGDLRRVLTALHGEVRIVETETDIRAEFRGTTVCRMVAYRELLHIQVGEHPVWETRVRTAAEFPEVVERVVRAFLHVLASNAGGPAGARPG
jgi:hypothetical protein